MAVYDIELLEVADRAYVGAGLAFNQVYEAAERAHDLEAQAGEERLGRYKEAFAGGLIIEQVVDPNGIEYLAGSMYVRLSSFDEGHDEAQWYGLDKAHAESLKGVLVNDVGVSGWTRVGRSFDDMPTPQRDLQLEFAIPGLHQNKEVNKRVERDIDEDPSTKYRSELRAIEWRLPTEEEIRAFGALATQAS